MSFLIDEKSIKLIQALEIFYEKLASKDIQWAVTGSMAHFLQGVKVIPKDIDIITTKSGAYKINSVFKDFMTKDVLYSHCGSMRSYFGSLKIDNIVIEIIAEIENEIFPNYWEPHDNWEKNIKSAFLNDNEIPVLSLSYEYYIYTKLGFTKRADLIQKTL